MGEKTARKYLIAGLVQGVGFRFFAERWANRLGVSGYVKNRGDGQVEVYAIGDRKTLETFKEQLSEGPTSARVSSLVESEEPVMDRYHGFSIEDIW